MSFTDRVHNAEDRGPLPWWTPTEKTPTIIGQVVEYRRIETDYGELRGAALEIEEPAVVQEKGEKPRLASIGELAMVWFKNKVLRNTWKSPSPVGGEPAIGDRVGIKYLGKRQNARGQTYPVFQVFVDGREGTSPSAYPEQPMPQADAIEDPSDYDDSFGDPAYQGADHDDLPF